jgi:hypothetical protein
VRPPPAADGRRPDTKGANADYHHEGRGMKTQEIALAQALTKGPMTTKEIRDKLGISSPSSIVRDLRHCGCTVMTELVTVRNRYGDKVSTARYFLIDYPDEVASECRIRKKRRRKAAAAKPARKKTARKAA